MESRAKRASIFYTPLLLSVRFRTNCITQMNSEQLHLSLIEAVALKVNIVHSLYSYIQDIHFIGKRKETQI